MAINIKGLSFGYDDEMIIENINLNLEKGGIYSLLGPNGVGKTTLMKVITGINHNFNGKIEVDGVSLLDLTRSKLAKKISYVPQNTNSKSSMKVLDFVVAGRNPYIELFDKPSEKDYILSVEALRDVGAHKLIEKNYDNLSGGEKQLVLIARAVCQNTDYMILDEPVANLDIKNQHQVYDILKGLSIKGKGILLSVHDPNLAYRYSDFAIMMANKKIIDFGMIDDVITENSLKKVYGMNFEIIKHNGQKIITI